VVAGLKTWPLWPWLVELKVGAGFEKMLFMVTSVVGEGAIRAKTRAVLVAGVVLVFRVMSMVR
jgi:hypothetical protein